MKLGMAVRSSWAKRLFRDLSFVITASLERIAIKTDGATLTDRLDKSSSQPSTSRESAVAFTCAAPRSRRSDQIERETSAKHPNHQVHSFIRKTALGAAG
jgi:hypothetical protein